jgi:hypothetical protein
MQKKAFPHLRSECGTVVRSGAAPHSTATVAVSSSSTAQRIFGVLGQGVKCKDFCRFTMCNSRKQWAGSE